jgi:uncharacterized membrane protein YdjX (TVP38/TMEM64 family)
LIWQKTLVTLQNISQIIASIWELDSHFRGVGGKEENKMASIKGFLRLALLIGVISLLVGLGNKYGYLDKDGLLAGFEQLKKRLGIWAIPAYVGAHTLTLALCLPYAVFFEAGASLLFGFVPGVLCVFTAKVLGASLSFWIGRLVPQFR